VTQIYRYEQGEAKHIATIFEATICVLEAIPLSYSYFTPHGKKGIETSKQKSLLPETELKKGE
jgi:hypothetical protein